MTSQKEMSILSRNHALCYIKMRPKAQVKMFETISILFIFLIMVVFGFIFYAGIQKTTFKREKEETISLNAIQVAQEISFFPEIQCSKENEFDCIDILKLQSAQRIMNDTDYYYPILGYSRITVKSIYPVSKNWTLYDKKPSENSVLETTSIQIPTSIFDPFTSVYYFGVINVEVYR